MTWILSGNPGEYSAAVGPFLAREPVAETVLLTLTRSLRERGADAFGDEAPLMGWWTDDAGQTAGALLQMPGRSLFLSRCPIRAVDDLADVLDRHADRIPEVRVAVEQETAARAAMSRCTGADPTVVIRTRLYRLGKLVPPDPGPEGTSHLATAAELPLVTHWFTDFIAEIGEVETPEQLAAQTEERIGRGEIRLWRTADGIPAAMAALSAPIEGMSRISLVYTPQEHRRHGYAGALTTELAQTALDAGTEQILLITDLANPTSNALYQRLGFEPVSESVVLAW